MMPTTPRKPAHEHTVPWFWPLAAAMELEQEGLRIVEDNLRYIGAAAGIEAPLPPQWATANRILRDLDTMRLREFTRPGHAAQATPVLIDAPYAGHAATIADYAAGQSLVETLLDGGPGRVLVTDWKSASEDMRDFDIDKYL
ncbi:MAG: esterase, partial [Planctomycetes bacterium]|nr:esterase [Planctomycetota bacterium]